MSYILPQPLVFQDFHKVPTQLVKNLNPFISGPNYRLFRYSAAAEKPLTGLGNYDRAAEAQYTFPNQPSASKVDGGYVKLYMDNVWAEYLTIVESSENAIVCDDSVQRNRLRATPHIGPWSAGADSGLALGNIDATRGPGYFVGNVNLPEAFYLYPYGGFTNGAWSANGWLSILSNNQDAAIKYITTEGVAGIVNVDGASNPMQSGNATVMDNIGMHLDFDTAARYIVTLSYSTAFAGVDDTDIIKMFYPDNTSTTFTFKTTPVSANDILVLGGTSQAQADLVIQALYAHAAAAPSTWGAAFIEAHNEKNLLTDSGEIKIYLRSPLRTDDAFNGTNADGVTPTGEAADYLIAPRTVRFVDANDLAYVELALRTSRIKDVIDWDCNLMTPLRLSLSFRPGATPEVSWDDITKTVVVISNTSAPYTINSLYAALTSNSDIAGLFNISKSSDTTVGVLDVVDAINYNWSGASLFLGYNDNISAVAPSVHKIVPTCFKNLVSANAYTFKTGNGFNRSAHFMSRDVQVGDRVRYQVTTPDNVTITCSTKVSALDNDMTPSAVGMALPAPTNVGYNEVDPEVGIDQSADLSQIEVTPGSDNQRAMDGTYSAVKTLSPVLRQYPGDYTNGLVADSFTVEITQRGGPGVAKCAVTNSTGSYTRVDVPIEAISPAATRYGSMAQAYLGNNLYIMFNKATLPPDPDNIFQVGDVYTFSAPAKAAYAAIDSANMYAAGTYIGESDTTYIVHVTRGGVFNRTATAVDGLNSLSSFAIHYTGMPGASDTVELGSSVATSTYTPYGYTVSTPTAKYQAMATAISNEGQGLNTNQGLRAEVVAVDAYNGTLYIYGPAESMEYGIGLSERFHNATAERTVVFAETAVNDWDAYGDKDDEYIVQCVGSGNIVTSRFSAASIGGDTRSGIAFGGFGNAGNNYQDIGNAGIQMRFVLQDKATKALAIVLQGAAGTIADLDTKEIHLGTNNVKIVFASGAPSKWNYYEYDGGWGSPTAFNLAAETVTGCMNALTLAINEAYTNGRTSVEAAITTPASTAAAPDTVAKVGQNTFTVTAGTITSFLGSIYTVENTGVGGLISLRTRITGYTAGTPDTVVTEKPYVFGVTDNLNFYDVNGVLLNVAPVTPVGVGTATTSNVAKLTTLAGNYQGYVVANGTTSTPGTLVATVTTAAVDTKSIVEVDVPNFFNDDPSDISLEAGRTMISGSVADINAITTTDSNISIPEAFTQEVNTAPWFEAGMYWMVKVLGSRPQVSISDTAGADQTSTAVVNDGEAVNLGTQGAYVVFEQNNNTEGGFAPGGGLAKGEKFFVVCQASAPGPYKVLVLSDDVDEAVTAGKDTDGVSVADPDRFGMWMYLVKSGVQIPSKRPLELSPAPTYNWWLDTNVDEQDVINVNSGIHIQDSSFYDGAGRQPYLEVYQGDMYVEYRALLTDYADAIYSIDDIGDVADTLGAIDTPDNPLGYGVYKAMENMTRRSCYFMAVPADTIEGWSEVINLAERNRDVYAFAPCTQNNEVFDLYEAHINAMSVETTKSWRIGFFSPELPETVAVYNKNTNPYQEEWTAEISDDRRYPGAQYRRLEFKGQYSPTTALADVKVGDIVRHSFSTDAWGSTTYVEDEVRSVESNTVLYLKNGLAAPTGAAIKVEVYHVYSVAEMADVIAETAAAFANRRIGSVFPAYAGSNGVVAPGWAVACAVAGLRSSLPPQQPMTNIAINGFDDLVLCYKTFSVTQLNKMAEYGTLIVMQDVAAGEVYIRHQLTTAAHEGDLNTAEFSITTNFDSCSYYFASVLAPFIGRYNITPQLIEVIQTQIESGINYLSSFTGAGLLGPQLIKDDGERKSEIKTLMQHPTLKDRLYAVVDLAMPYPFNNIELHLVV